MKQSGRQQGGNAGTKGGTNYRAGSGIGKAVALALALRSADIVAADVNRESSEITAEDARSIGRKALGILVDVREISQLQSIVDISLQGLGRIDTLGACAGVVQQQPILDNTELDWDRIFGVNYRGLFFTNQLVARQMVQPLNVDGGQQMH